MVADDAFGRGQDDAVHVAPIVGEAIDHRAAAADRYRSVADVGFDVFGRHHDAGVAGNLGRAGGDELMHVKTIPGVDAHIGCDQKRHFVERNVAQRHIERNELVGRPRRQGCEAQQETDQNFASEPRNHCFCLPRCSLLPIIPDRGERDRPYLEGATLPI